MKAILINPHEETITEVEYSGNYKEIYDLIGCTTFDCVRIYETQDMYIDDEGLLKNNQMYFTMNDRVYAGKALLLSHDVDGDKHSTYIEL